jgi:UDP-N-acetylmuramoyl-tripeptide--D-alanyl-D-alanine ligase
MGFLFFNTEINNHYFHGMNPQIKKIHSYISKGANISTDTRKIEEGSVFFALKGENFDANDFALQAIDKGAIAAIVDSKNLTQHPKLIVVDDVLLTLQQLASYHRSQFNIPVIGITGSNGKTTTKELINAALSKKYNTLCTKGNLNNHIGVPLTLLGLNKDHQIAIIEMGANHMGEIGFLSSLAKPTSGLITNIGKAHIEGFGSFENIIIGKSELYQHLTQNNGTTFINSDNEILMKRYSYYTHGNKNIEESPRCILYGIKSSNHYIGTLLSASPFLELNFRTSVKNTPTSAPFHINSKLLGSYNFENILATTAVAHHYGVEPLQIIEAIESYNPTNSRSQLKDSGKNTLIMDAYNANPTSMKAAIENFSTMETTGPKGLILGDMLEMGDSAAAEHAEIIRIINSIDCDFALLIGTEFSRIAVVNKKITQFVHTSDAARWLIEHPILHHTILLKGSRGMQLEILEKYL